jgi:uncharacterized protein
LVLVADNAYWAKIYVVKHEVVLAMCDKELIGKKLKGKYADVKVERSFYGERIIDDDVMVEKLLKHCGIGNLMGRRIVAFAIKKGFITKENVISIGGVPHAQFVKM